MTKETDKKVFKIVVHHPNSENPKVVIERVHEEDLTKKELNDPHFFNISQFEELKKTQICKSRLPGYSSQVYFLIAAELSQVDFNEQDIDTSFVQREMNDAYADA